MVEWLTLYSRSPAGAMFQPIQKRKSAQIQMQFVHDSTLVYKKKFASLARPRLSIVLLLRKFILALRGDSAIKGNAQCTLCSYKL